ncbi:unnamed protein product [Gongylonema pulchrum]|uniref:Peptidase M12B domain-containing protein n=1 Tax=Gongylonema pulchrum TaxID=637853 RepID=A0A183E533_9BILA|nr:unnamed protein product [Gongylonema pulchrum]
MISIVRNYEYFAERMVYKLEWKLILKLLIGIAAGLETLAHRNGQAQTLLNLFCRHQYDIYHTTTSVAGVAPVARMCDEVFACSLVEGLHLGRSFVLAHEMGHKCCLILYFIENANS